MGVGTSDGVGVCGVVWRGYCGVVTRSNRARQAVLFRPSSDRPRRICQWIAEALSIEGRRAYVGDVGVSVSVGVVVW